MLQIETKSNGYEAEEIQDMIGIFEKAAEKLFGNCTIRHFYYGDRMDMADVVFNDRHYAHFNITMNRVSLSGYSMTDEQMKKCGSMTHNDELYKGKLLEIAAAR